MKKMLISGISVLTLMFISISGVSAATNNEAEKNGKSYTEIITLETDYEEYAKALHLRIENGIIVTASPRDALDFPTRIEPVNNKAVIDLRKTKGYVFALDDTSETIYISNAAKDLVGLADSFYAVTSDGAFWPATPKIENGYLQLTTKKSDVNYFGMEYIDATVPNETLYGVNRASLINVPSNYVYDPSRGALHDYCTSSPDKFPNPFGADADFRGPCALHDMCYERKGCASRSCDTALLNNLKNNCRATYSSGLTLGSCMATANVYYAAVTAVHIFNYCT